MLKETIDYIIQFLMDGDSVWKKIYYGKPDSAPAGCRVVIVPSGFFNDLNTKSKKKTDLNEICYLHNENKTPVFFGSGITEKLENKVVLHADIIASTFYFLSRYEEIQKRNQRDQFGRFLLKHSILSQNGWIFRPIVDEYSEYLRCLFADVEKKKSSRKHGFKKIYLTHDIDEPFYFDSISRLMKQTVQNILPGYKTEKGFIDAWIHYQKDPYYTFPRIIQYDSELAKKLNPIDVEPVYFLITAKANQTNRYYDVQKPKYKKLQEELRASGATLGLHISHEAGIDPKKIQGEVSRLPIPTNAKLYSRHHFLRWREPEHIEQMEKAGITDDFTLAYADSAGFRVGTCRPYRFIHPITGELTNVKIHPLEIMECSLDRKEYMGLDYGQALKKSKEIIRTVYQYYGELNLLFHNSSLQPDGFDYERLYRELLNYIGELCTGSKK